MISGMNKRVVNPVTARMCRHHQSRGPQRAPLKGLVEHDFLVDRVGVGPRFLLIGQRHISMWWWLIQPYTTPKKIGGVQIGKDFLPKVFGWFKRNITGFYVVFRRAQWQQSWQFFNLHLTKYQYEWNEWKMLCAAKNNCKKNARHQTCSRVETGVSSDESTWCLTK